jgi:hypothetical protein
VAQPAPDPLFASGLLAFSFVTALPQNEDVFRALEGNPLAQSSLSDAESLALIFIGSAVSADGSGEPQDFNLSIDFALDPSLIAEIRIGLVNPVILGNGFDVLHFGVQQNGSDVVDETFTSPVDAMTFFNDNVITLLDISPGLSGDLEFGFFWDMVSNDLGSGFQASLLVDTILIPEPATLGLMLFGWFGVLRRRVR